MSINKCAVLNIYCMCVAFLPAIVLWAYGEPPLFAAMFAFFILPAARVRLARACATATGFLLALEVVKYEMCRVKGGGRSVTMRRSNRRSIYIIMGGVIGRDVSGG